MPNPPTTPVPLTALTPGVAKLYAAVAERARGAGVFGDVGVDAGMVRCQAKDSAEPAEYRLLVDAGKLWVALVTPHRWLSQSIEADLVHTGDKIEELVEEELVNLGWKAPPPPRLPFEHFRDEHKLYTFRTPLPVDLSRADAPETIDRVALALLAYEAAFRPLGDMEADDEE
jgi:hypothetical protein